MKREVLILGDSRDPGRLSSSDLEPYSSVVLLFWSAPETRSQIRDLTGATVYCLREIIGSIHDWHEQAGVLADQVAQTGPAYRGMPWRSSLAEAMFREALVVIAVMRTLDVLRNLAEESGAGHIDVDLAADGDTASLLTALGEAPGSVDIRFRASSLATSDAGRHRKPNRLRRLVNRASDAARVGGWSAHLWNLLDQLDRRYSLRVTLARVRRAFRPPPGGTILLSSYANNSRVLKTIESELPLPVLWVVTNLLARRAARGGRTPAAWLWRFGGRSGVSTAPEALCQRPEVVADSKAIGAQWLALSPAWRYWTTVGHRSIVRLTECWEECLDRMRPRLVAAAGLWGLDGWLASVARRRGVPVVQLLHGIVDGPFYTGRSVDADRFLVWGAYWKQLFPESERSRIAIAAPRGIVVRKRPDGGRRVPRITFFSWPFAKLPFYNEDEILGSLIDLFHRIGSTGTSALTVRFHPLESPSDFCRRWEGRHGGLPKNLSLEKEAPLEQTIGETDIALMLRSTVMLDCAASGVPTIVLDWFDYDWGEIVGNLEGISLASGFSDVERLLAEWTNEPPRVEAGGIEKLIASESSVVQDLEDAIEHSRQQQQAASR